MQLQLKHIHLSVSLGVPDEERATTQTVLLDLNIQLNPKAGLSDNIGDTICYATLYEKLQQFCHDKAFHLIEYLAQQLWDYLYAIYPDIAFQKLVLRKNPPIDSIQEASIVIERDN